ncbi:MAG: hypothetical protein OXR66_01975 [Candidatus Woesearchaeota archaeon]|nr:hypothetical protein [Candidatus Woesearchaeota archaeon]
MTLELGGNITLAGFDSRDFTEMIVVKKMVGQYARQFSDHITGFSGLKITLKSVHETKSEIHVLAAIDGHEVTSTETAHNLYIALDTSLKKSYEQARKHVAN